tara:strand:- start:688 stop:870 length:183 start_codon:yes stop_codon:yes gene_type:complete
VTGAEKRELKDAVSKGPHLESIENNVASCICKEPSRLFGMASIFSMPVDFTQTDEVSKGK